MIVTAARKKSMDPVQEALRERKALWNKEVSAFIDNLIHAKKLMNGWPSKFHMERSRITDPLPKDPATILGVLANDFKDLAVEGNEIIAQQIAYSQTRRKKKQNTNSIPNTTQTPMTQEQSKPDLSQQLMSQTSFDFDNNFIVEGSNPMTRLLSKMKGPFFGAGAKERKYRFTLLSEALSLYKICSKFQVEVLRKGKESIDNSNLILEQIENGLMKFTVDIENFSEQLGKKIKVVTTDTPATDNKKTENDPTTVSAPDQNIEQILNDFLKNVANVLDMDPELSRKMRDLASKYSQAKTDQDKFALSNDIINTYKAIVSDLGAKRGITANSISEIVEKTSKTATAQINVLAQAFLKKWLGKARHNSSLLGDTTSASRLIAYESAEKMREGLEKMMDSLEKEFNSEYLTSIIQDVFKSFFTLQRSFKTLLPGIMLTDPTSLKGDLKKKLEDMIEKKRMLQLTRNLTGVKR